MTRIGIIIGSTRPGRNGDRVARVDLAASMPAPLDDDRHLRSTVGVGTTDDNPTLLRWIRREALAGSTPSASAPTRSPT
ncbi:hypothetical protein GCM10010260_57630 [Streptomyces filipinensis]|uniref:Uncharacterized protein n=1 Tax=Streptomyces filipinensis TaxID=66887 RepID=A0A918IGC0_9ACTN|nr:hypothetical protein [Streptomyces filipinensis]GGV11410.1 hypothetical protein GCM10010260_57630 [Streptomyces filipinensis]